MIGVVDVSLASRFLLNIKTILFLKVVKRLWNIGKNKTMIGQVAEVTYVGFWPHDNGAVMIMGRKICNTTFF